MEKEPKYVKLTKVSDDAFKPIGYRHPHGIEEGFKIEGLEVAPPTVHERYYVGMNFSTSRVVRIIDLNNFETEYSTYHIAYK